MDGTHEAQEADTAAARAAAQAGPPDPLAQPREWLAWAYSVLDSATCDGCTTCAAKCAGPFGVWREEHDALRAAAAEAGLPWPRRWPGDEWDACPFLRDDRLCSVYAARPLVCRAFGLVPWLPCPEGRAESLADDLCRQVVKGYVARERRPLSGWDE